MAHVAPLRSPCATTPCIRLSYKTASTVTDSPLSCARCIHALCTLAATAGTAGCVVENVMWLMACVFVVHYFEVGDAVIYDHRVRRSVERRARIELAHAHCGEQAVAL